MYVASKQAWDDFLRLPLAEATQFGLPPIVLRVLEERFGAIYVRQIQALSREDLMRVKNIGIGYADEMRIALTLMLRAVERGEMEWILKDLRD